MKQSLAFTGMVCCAGLGAAGVLVVQATAIHAQQAGLLLQTVVALAGLAVALCIGHTSRLASRLAQAQQKLQLAARSAKPAASMQHQFLRLIDCELRSPLQAIVTAAESLAQDSLLAQSHPQSAIALRRIQRGVVALQSQLHDLLTLARAERGSAGDGKQTAWSYQHADVCMSFDAREWLRDVCTEVEDAAQAKGLSLEISTLAETQHIHADTIRLGQVLRNLLSHAIRRLFRRCLVTRSSLYELPACQS
jgi:signal transduction histidine kinase